LDASHPRGPQARLRARSGCARAGSQFQQGRVPPQGADHDSRPAGGRDGARAARPAAVRLLLVAAPDPQDPAATHGGPAPGDRRHERHVVGSRTAVPARGHRPGGRLRPWRDRARASRPSRGTASVVLAASVLRARQRRVAPRRVEPAHRTAHRPLAAGARRGSGGGPVGGGGAVARGGWQRPMSATGRSIDRETEGRGWTQERAILAAAAIIFGGALAAGILAADAPVLVVVGASVLFLGIAMVLRPDIATLAGIGLIYSNLAVVMVRFHGAPGFVAAMVPLLLVVPLARDLVVRRLPVVAPQPLRWMLVLFGIYLVSALFSADTQRSWDEVVTYVTEGLLLYFLVINVVRSPGMIRGVTWVLIAGGALVSAAAVHQAITGNYDSNYGGLAQATSLIR